MNRKTLSTAAIAFAVVATYSIRASAQSVRVEGSSAGLTISQAAAAEFHRAHRATTVNVGLAGSGGAFGKLCRNAADLVHSGRPILKSEIEACGKAAVQFIELPIAFDAVTVVVNPRNSFVRSLTLPELRAMWEETAEGRIVRWNQVNALFPDAPLKLLAPDARFEDSNYFAAAILGPGKSSRRDYMGSVDDNVLIQGVMRDVNTVSYLPIATYLENRAKLRAVPIAALAGAQPVDPSLEAVSSGRYQPLSRPVFLYVNAGSLARAEGAAFAEFYVANAGRLAQGANYLALTGSLYSAAQERLRRRILGSVWNGIVPVGLNIQELQRREAL
jgi:phosphate transport system substrate-binding protein